MPSIFKPLLKFVSVFILSTSAFGQIQSPKDFLGYDLGSKFTRHHRIIEYTNYIQSQINTNSKIILYGQSNEGRTLETIVLSSASNIANLEKIKADHLAQVYGSMPFQANAPLIIWLSYNVHGNEASSSEAYMKVLYDIATNPELYLIDDMVLILDPCINPDGRDRYTNWYNMAVGYELNTDSNSREHHEPWPKGRTNHYGYDLNRDWLWQTQLESQQRLQLYNNWMPHIHADFHEMGAEDSYYFPPAARPFHTVITSWQRNFQETLGSYIRQPFDKNGWGYFTKENYDLLYPSYGDTYPIYNGAIGMTLEQGGSSRAGLSYVQASGDTLTLLDRLTHHHATSFQIIAAAKSKKQQLNQEFVNFFNNARSNGVGAYKSYVLKAGNDARRLLSLLSLLDKQGIQYFSPKPGSKMTGFNFTSKKEESFTIAEQDIVVSTQQTKGTLVNVLFEPSTYVEDSNTYDITAWALPYVYNLEAFALNSVPAINLEVTDSIWTGYTPEPQFAYLVEWKNIQDAQFLAQLYKNDISVDVQTEAFISDGIKYAPGTLIIKPKKAKQAIFENIVANHHINIHSVASGMVSSGPDLASGSTKSLQKPKVALLVGEGTSVTAVGDIWHYFDKVINYPISLLETSYFKRVDIWDYNTIIIADGKYKDEEIDKETLERWVKDGGSLILIEGGMSIAADEKNFGLKSKKNRTTIHSDEPSIYGDRNRDKQKDQIAGAIFKVKIDNTHPLGFGYKSESYFLIHEKPNFELLENNWNVGHIGSEGHMAGIAGSLILDASKNSLVFGSESKGKGKVVYMTTNPVFRGFWEEGKLILANAVFMNP